MKIFGFDSIKCSLLDQVSVSDSFFTKKLILIDVANAQMIRHLLQLVKCYQVDQISG